ncbi:MAG: hypothetical protein IH820_16070, partial [Bacteroidetes bacterium]|nr:hypothetical protein [Bacteroidota bacterium]
LFEKSVFYYERGFYIKQDYYTGINAAFMYTVKAADFAEEGNTFEAIVYYGHANLIRKKVADICLKLVDSESFASRGDKEWVYLTLYEAYFGRELYDEAEEYVPFIKKFASDFALDSFEDQKAKLTEIMERFKSKVPMSGGDGADFSAPTPAAAPGAAEEAEPAVTAVAVAPPTTPVPATAAAPRIHQTPEGAISIDLGNLRGKSVKSVEVNCKVEFE